MQVEYRLKVPTLQQARTMLDEAAGMNPGPWVAHSQITARAARLIAAELSELDPEAAYILGCLHDIGRREGVHGMRHAIDGYQFLAAQGFEDAARICLTHSFPIPIAAAGSDWDGTPADFDFLQDYLDHLEYDIYDRLIQMCDSISQPTGYCLMEKRLVDVALRYGFNPHTRAKWQAFIGIRQDFELKLGKSIYSLLPGIVENTFESQSLP
ncbi:MAG TPA: HD domain-containing protein [Anaerolineales bacterium]|nr:HD domain-containing protein [Anaerolineales bacterium]